MKLSALKRMLEFDAMIGIVIIILTAGGMPLVDPDFFWHLKNGELLLADRVLFEQDFFSHTVAGTHLQVTGWFFDAAIAFIWQNYGAIGIRIFSAFFIGLTWLGIYKCASLFIQRKETCALFGLLGIALLAPLFAVRPNLFTHCAVVWVLFCLLGFMKSNSIKYLWSLIPLFAVWPNFHYGFAVGLVLIGLFFASAVLDRLAPLSSSRPLSGFLRSTPVLISAACVLAVAVNPYGLQVYPDTLLSSMRAADSVVAEWQSPSFKAFSEKLLLVSIFTYLVVIFLIDRKASWLLLLVPGTMLFTMLLALRNQGFWVVILPAFLAIGVSEILTQRESQLLRRVPHPQVAYFVNAVILMVTVPAVILGSPVIQQRQKDAAAEWIPAAATDFMLNNIPDGNLFNPYGSGGYLIWRTYPRFPVFVDGRYAPYTSEIMKTYLHIISGLPNSIDLLKNHNVEIALVNTHTALSELLYLSQDYRTVYSDPGHSIYVIDTDKFAQIVTVERATIGLQAD